MKPRIYLDNNASTALDPRVERAIALGLKETLANPSSIHSFGQEARNLVTKARRLISSYLGIKAQELIFTSGGTEAANMIIRGLFGPTPCGHILTSNVEHSCVYHTVKFMEQCGCDATFLSPGLWGAPTPKMVLEALRSDTKLIALMAVNNETGVKTDIDAIAKIAQDAKVPFFVDGVALLGKEHFSFPDGVSAACFSGHKFHAPKGIGLAFIRQGLKLAPLLIGGGQEYQKRGGTENLIGIIGVAEAIRILQEDLPEACVRMAYLRNYFEENLLHTLPEVVVNGEGPRVVNTANLSFLGLEGESLLMNLDLAGLAVSHGSACSSGALEPSRILLNMGILADVAASSIRFSLSRFTTQDEIDQSLEIVQKVVRGLRMLISPKRNRTFIPASAE